jgi:hypothetical protein
MWWWFLMDICSPPADKPTNQPTLPSPLPHQEVDNLPASEARRRLEAYRKRQQAAAAAKAKADAGGEGGEEAAAAAVRGAFEGAISSAFEGALKHYVAEEQKEVRAWGGQGGCGGSWVAAEEGTRLLREVHMARLLRAATPATLQFPAPHTRVMMLLVGRPG